MSISKLPPELLLPIIHELEHSDLVNVVKSTRQLYALGIEHLYNSIDLTHYSNQQLRSAVANLTYTLKQSSNNSKHIRKLKFRYSTLKEELVHNNLLQDLLELIPTVTYTLDGRKEYFELQLTETEPDDILHAERITSILAQIPKLECLVMAIKRTSIHLTVKRDLNNKDEELYEFVK